MDLDRLLDAAQLVVKLRELRKALEGVPAGKQVKRGRGKKVHDYSHLSPNPEYQVLVHQQSTIPGKHLLEVQVHHGGQQVGEVTGSVGNGALLMGNAEIAGPHQGKGLGKAANLALIVHAHQLGAQQVVGDAHTEDSARVYRSLARDYGFDYNAPKTGRLYGAYRYALKSEMLPTLAKARPTWKFPGLGLKDDRRETPIVDSPLEVASKEAAIERSKGRAGNIFAAQDMARQFKENPSAPAPARPWGKTAIRNPETATISYAKGPSVLGQPIEASVGTQLHEDVHQMFNRVEAHYGQPARIALAAQLYTSIPKKDREFLDFHLDHYRRDLKQQNHPMRCEEALAHLVTYLNDGVTRENFHSANGHTDEVARDYGTVMKRIYRHVQREAATKQPRNIGPRRDAPVRG